MVVIKFSYEKGVYMQVSAVSAKSTTMVFNTKANSHYCDGVSETFSNYINTKSKTISSKKQDEIYDSINEWKNFCHSQIEKGYFDIIA